MMRSSTFSAYQVAQPARKRTPTTKGAADFLRAHDRMAALLPAATRMAALQKECCALLPTAFDTCSIFRFESGQLVLSVPNAALAAKLKQQLPKLQEGLLKRGFEVSAIRIKLQPRNIVINATKPKSLVLPTQAVSALAKLNTTLEDSPHNAALKAAIAAMLERHRRAKG
jgi:hypothetical protein